MDLQQAYSNIDKCFSNYITSRIENEKSKMLKTVCDIINSDFRYKKALANGDFDYLPVLTATNDAIKYFDSENECRTFHKYLFVCIENAINKDIEINQMKRDTNLNFSNIKLLKKIKKLLPLYQDNKQKVADALDISLAKLESLLYSQTSSLNDKVGNDESESEYGDSFPSELMNADKELESKEDLAAFLEKLDSVWKDMKPIHQGVISDWLTAVSLSVFEQPPAADFMQQKEEACSFLSNFKYVNRIIVDKFFDEENYQLPVTFYNIGLLHGITKAAVCKKVAIFTEELRKKVKKF